MRLLIQALGKMLRGGDDFSFLTAPDFVGQHLWPPSDAATSKLCNQLS